MNILSGGEDQVTARTDGGAIKPGAVTFAVAVTAALAGLLRIQVEVIARGKRSIFPCANIAGGQR